MAEQSGRNPALITLEEIETSSPTPILNRFPHGLTVADSCLSKDD